MRKHNKYITYLIKDIRLNLNNKYAFLMQFISPIFYLIIFYNISVFVSKNNDLGTNEYFLYASIGVCLVDILATIINSQAREIVNLKTSGVIEEIIFIDENVTSTLIAMSTYSIFLSIIKMIFYFFTISLFMGYIIIPLQNILFFLATLFFLIVSFVALALICGAYSLYFNKLGFLPILFVLMRYFLGKRIFLMIFCHLS